jgi:hypothetical protein
VLWKEGNMINPIMEYKEKTGKSYTELAEEIGIPVPTLWRHANGDRDISLPFAMRYNKRWRIPFARMVETGNREEQNE